MKYVQRQGTVTVADGMDGGKLVCRTRGQLERASDYAPVPLGPLLGLLGGVMGNFVHCVVHAVNLTRTDPKSSSVFRTISPLGRGRPKQLVEDIFFFNSWKHSSSLVVHLQGVFCVMRSVRGADGQVKLWIWAKTRVHIVANIQNFALRVHCAHVA